MVILRQSGLLQMKHARSATFLFVVELNSSTRFFAIARPLPSRCHLHRIAAWIPIVCLHKVPQDGPLRVTYVGRPFRLIENDRHHRNVKIVRQEPTALANEFPRRSLRVLLPAEVSIRASRSRGFLKLDKALQLCLFRCFANVNDARVDHRGSKDVYRQLREEVHAGVLHAVMASDAAPGKPC